MKLTHTTILLIAGLLALSACNNTPENIDGVETFTIEGKGVHKEGKISYEQTPPAGGPHNQVWQNCGVYDKPIYNEHAVHALEHGAVWITYQPDLPQADVDKLVEASKANSYTLVSPYPDLPSKVVVSAWGKQLKLESADDKRIKQFINKYAQSSEAPEPGATCSGGTSITQ
ncbi:DUF3105 domain-containing protein [Deinococcus roseus]|uniref:DUF3105 domain-containing protein n=1 Tax=Deinococcus roseus TaxID=392414 RepID=A0ABQ2CWA2_9DEIO|nr:DUF3105 domain-containing protein [Deinococcus roseus]GGJ26865.1 hypothetical protein GCM10008938_11250 [Deinococcus roseus]